MVKLERVRKMTYLSLSNKLVVLLEGFGGSVLEGTPTLELALVQLRCQFLDFALVKGFGMMLILAKKGTLTVQSTSLKQLIPLA